MGGQAGKEWTPIILQILPHLHSAYQKFSKDSQKSNEEKKKMKDTLQTIENYQKNVSMMTQDLAQMKQVVEGLTLMLNYQSQNGRVPPSAPPSVPMAPGGPTLAYSTVPGNYNPGTQPGIQAKSDIRITMTQQDLLALITRTLASEFMQSRDRDSSYTRDVNGAIARREGLEQEEPSTPPVPREQLERFSEDPLRDIMCCDVCGLHYNKDDRKPIILPDCGHTFCRRCLITASRNMELRCPTCRRGCRVPAEHLPPNYTVLSLVSEVNSTAAINGTPSATTNPSSMNDDEQMKYVLDLSRKLYEEEQDLLLAQQLQEEENAKAMMKGKKGKTSKLHAWEDVDQDDVDQPYPCRQNHGRDEGGQDAMNAYYSARRLMEEEDGELDTRVPYHQQHDSVLEDHESYRHDANSERGVELEDEGSGSDEDAQSWGESNSLRLYRSDVGRESPTPAESINDLQRETHSHRECMTDVGRELQTPGDSTYDVRREPHAPRESMDDIQRESHRPGESTYEQRESHAPRESMGDVHRESFTPGENISNAGRASCSSRDSINDAERESHTRGESLSPVCTPTENRNNKGREADSPKDNTGGARGTSYAKHLYKKPKEGSLELPPMEKDLEHYIDTHFYGKDGRKSKSASLDEETRSMLARALEREQQEREGSHKRKARRLLKEQEQIDLAIALSRSLQDASGNDDSDKDEKEKENEE